MRYTPQMSYETEPRFAPLALLRHVSDHVRWPVLAIILLYTYLAFHALSGSQGIMSWMNNDSRAVVLQSRLDVLQSQKTKLEDRVNALDVTHLDIDALDQLSRDKLYYSYPKEFTIWLDPKG